MRAYTTTFVRGCRPRRLRERFVVVHSLGSAISQPECFAATRLGSCNPNSSTFFVLTYLHSDLFTSTLPATRATERAKKNIWFRYVHPSHSISYDLVEFSHVLVGAPHYDGRREVFVPGSSHDVPPAPQSTYPLITSPSHAPSGKALPGDTHLTSRFLFALYASAAERELHGPGRILRW